MATSEPSAMPTIRSCQERLHQLYGIVQQEQRRRIRQWEDEAPMLETQIQALTGTKEIIIREQKQITAQLTNLKALLDSQVAAATAAMVEQPDASLTGTNVTMLDLQQQLVDLQSKVADQEQALTRLQDRLADPDACRPDERSIYETQLVVLQDTRRLLQTEVAAITAEIKRRELSAQLETDRQSAAQVGLSDLGRLSEQLASTEARLDRAKLDTYFPKIKGFRFSGGGGGVYCGAKDLQLCEISGAFSVALEALPQQQQQQQAQQQQQQQQQQETRLKITLSGVSESFNNHTFKPQHQTPDHVQQQQQPTGDQQATAKKPAEQQQQEVTSASNIGSSHPTTVQRQQQQEEAIPVLAAAAAGAVADGDAALRTSSSKNSPSSDADWRSPAGHAVTSTSATPSDTDLSGATRHLTHSGTFADTDLAKHGGTSSDSNSVAPAAKPDVAAAAPLTQGDTAAVSEAQLPGQATQQQAPQQQQQQQCSGVPPGSTGGRSDAAGGSLLHRQSSASSSGSMNSDMGRSPGHDGQTKNKLSSRMDSMKGKFGGFMAESRQKLQENRQKLQASKFVTESRQMLEDSRQKIQDSKLLAESRTAAKQLLENSRTFAARSEAEIKQKFSNLQQQQKQGHQRQRQRQRQQQQQQGLFQQGITQVSTEQQQHQQQQQSQQQQSQQQHEELAQLAAPGTTISTRLTNQQQQQQQQGPDASLPTSQAPANHHQQQQVCPGPPSPSHTAAAAAAHQTPTAPASPQPTAQQQRPQFSGSSSHIASPRPAAANAAGVDGAAGGVARKGVVVTLLAEGLEVVGERGTKVPNIRAAQLSLEVEVCMNATFTYTPPMGWQSAGLNFEVVSLERQVQGTNIPLPKTLIRSVLNMIMPSVFTKLLLTSLPHELGKFIIDSSAAASNGGGLWLSGEISLAGPSAACLSANLALSSDDVPKGRADVREFAKDLRAAQQARSLLDMPDPLHAKTLARLFNLGTCCLLPGGYAGVAANGGSSSGSNNSSSSSSCVLSIRDLCRFYLQYSGSSVWSEICDVWQTAVDLMWQQQGQQQQQQQLAQDEGQSGSDQNLNYPSNSSSHSKGSGHAGIATEEAGTGSNSQSPPHSSAGSNNISIHKSNTNASSFNFTDLMTRHVRGLTRKPVRVRGGVHELLLCADVAAALAAARDFWDRSTREWAENAKGEDAVRLLRTPLPQRLEQIQVWYAGAAAAVSNLSKQFHGAGAKVLVTADSKAFGCVVKHANYEGPLKIQVPIPALADLSSGSCRWDISLPDPNSNNSSIASKIRFVSNALFKAAFGTNEDEQEQQRVAAAAQSDTNGVPATLAAELESLMDCWRQQHKTAQSRLSSNNVVGQTSVKSGNNLHANNAAPAACAAGNNNSTQTGLLSSSNNSCSLGVVSISKLSLGLVLDRNRFHESLISRTTDSHLVTDLSASFGQLFTASLATNWQQQQGPESMARPCDVQGSLHPTGVLQIATNDITCVRAGLEHASFASAVTPGAAVRLAHIIVLAVALKFLGSNHKTLGKINQVFGHVFDYLSKDCLGMLVSADVSATGNNSGKIQLQLHGTPPVATVGAMNSRQHANEDVTWPIQVINDVDLITVLDTVKLLTRQE